MPVNRFFTNKDLKKGGTASVVDAEHHHLAHVIRSKEGDAVELVNGRGFLAKGVIEQVGRQEAVVKVRDVSFEAPPKCKVIIAQAIPKTNRLEFILEKCTELGMDELWLFPGERSEKKKIKDSQIKRMETILTSAMKQSGRLYIPKLIIKDHFSKWKDFPTENVFYGDVDPNAPKLLAALNGKMENDHYFFIGPESGLTDAEDSLLRNKGAKGIKLHDNILRTDTAPMVILSVIGMLG